jgi:hypothetical protein
MRCLERTSLREALEKGTGERDGLGVARVVEGRRDRNKCVFWYRRKERAED